MITRRVVVSGLAAVLFGAVAALGMMTGAANAAGKSIDWNNGQIQWRSFDEGMRESASSGKPVMVVFYAEWCKHCVAYSRLFQDPKVVELARSLVMVRVDTDAVPAVVARFPLDGAYVPRTVIFSKDGKPVETINNGQSQFRYFLDYSSTSELLDVMQKAVKIGPSSH